MPLPKSTATEFDPFTWPSDAGGGQRLASWPGGNSSSQSAQAARLREAESRATALAERNAELAGHLAGLLEALPAGIVILDGDGRVQDCNSTASDFLGEPLRGCSWASVRGRALSDVSGGQGELTLSDGRTVNLTHKPVGPGRALLFTDVTEQRQVRELLARERRLASLGEMAAALAHQLRTPLSAALLYAENAGRTELTAERGQELLGKSRQCLRDMEQLISDMLHFARGAGTAETTIEVAELMNSVVTMAAAVTRDGQRVHVHDRIPDITQPLTLTGNREVLGGAILNLITNALQHAGPTAEVTVALRRNGLDLEMLVTDNGPGVDPAIAGRIFDPFVTSRPDGTGLGLSVSRSVARAHRGDLKLLPNTAFGASFLLRLPLSKGSAQTVEAFDGMETEKS